MKGRSNWKSMGMNTILFRHISKACYQWWDEPRGDYLNIYIDISTCVCICVCSNGEMHLVFTIYIILVCMQCILMHMLRKVILLGDTCYQWWMTEITGNSSSNENPDMAVGGDEKDCLQDWEQHRSDPCMLSFFWCYMLRTNILVDSRNSSVKALSCATNFSPWHPKPITMQSHNTLDWSINENNQYRV